MAGAKILIAPECFDEFDRKVEVDKYLELKQWDMKTIFKRIIGSIRKEFGINGVSVSILTLKHQIVKHESLLNTTGISRAASIDAHTILSKDHLLMTDASKDWRTTNYPLVTGFPYIKFYCGVPLLAPNKVVIGVLAIFDSFEMPNFTPDKIESLKAHAAHIMEKLNTPIEMLAMQNPHIPRIRDANRVELDDLINQLGRATSRGSQTTQARDTTSPYSQQHTFKFTSELHQNDDVAHVNRAIWEKVIRTNSLKKSAGIVAKFICNTYNIDFLYIIEIKIAEEYQIGVEYLPQGSVIDSAELQYPDKLVKTNEDDVYMCKRITSFGNKGPSLKFEKSIHSKAFSSEFGIAYENTTPNAVYNSGIIMPFYRHSSKLVRKPPADKDHTSKVKVVLRSGGYLVGCFNEQARPAIGPETISKIFSHLCVMRKAYL